MRIWEFVAASEDETRRLGAALAGVLPDGAVVALVGTLGAGKTRLVQAIAAASGVDPTTVASPTFVLIHEYHGRRPIYHFDAYRLQDDDEFLALGPEEYFAGGGLSLVEWADRVERCLPAERLVVHIQIESPTARSFQFTAAGPAIELALDALRTAIGSMRGT
jgi:tRNA threonylcarbamoyladenosine biosynthesis protein TsaE